MTIKVQVSSNFPAPPLSSAITVTITTTPATIPPTARNVYFNIASAASITLPSAAAWAAANPDGILFLKDISNAALTNNITINRAGSNTADGLTSFVISANFGSYSLRVAPSGNWTFVGV